MDPTEIVKIAEQLIHIEKLADAERSAWAALNHHERQSRLVYQQTYGVDLAEVKQRWVDLRDALIRARVEEMSCK